MMRATSIASQVLLAVLGGYAFSAATSAALALALWRLVGLDRGEAVLLAAMLGFVVYLVVLLWAFAARGLPRVAAGLLGGTLAGYALVHWLLPAAAAIPGG